MANCDTDPVQQAARHDQHAPQDHREHRSLAPQGAVGIAPHFDGLAAPYAQPSDSAALTASSARSAGTRQVEAGRLRIPKKARTSGASTSSRGLIPRYLYLPGQHPGHGRAGRWQGGRRCAVAWLSSTAGLRGGGLGAYPLMKLSRSVLKVSL